MKIVYISTSTIPSVIANSIHVMKMCQALANNGHDVVLYAKAPNHPFDLDDVYKQYGVADSFRINYLKFYNLPYYGHIYGLLMAISAVKAKPDLVIGRHPAGCFFSALFGLNVIFEIHSPINETGRITKWLFNIMRRLNSFKKLILITNALKEKYVCSITNIDVNKLVVLPDAADSIDFNSIRPKGIRKANKINIGYTGHLYKGKGMEIIAELIDKSNGYFFHVVGGKPDDIVFWEEKVKKSENISFYGAVPHSEIPMFLMDFDIVLIPNQREVKSNAGKEIGSWTSPLKLFEYMAAKKPIIASDIPVLREVLTNGKNALLCDPENTEEWLSALKLLARNTILRKAIAQNAFDDFLKYYTWSNRAVRILDSIGIHEEYNNNQKKP